MASDRLAAGIEVSGLIRRIEGMGGHAMVLAKGHREAGAILLLLAERGQPHAVLERVLTVAGEYRWQRTGPQDIEDSQSLNLYMQRRRGYDPDLWILELDIAGVERFADEMTASG